jgi:eukaryotic-like serine/threonine-protein kinase
MVGERLGPWVIDAEIGRGAMGNVWKAHRDGTADVAAVKVLDPELAREAMFIERFRREIEALEQLQHPNIVRFIDGGEQNGRFYYAMEYIDGRDCEWILRDRGRLPWPEVLEIAQQVVAGLKHAHDCGVIHRDLKPANILIAPAADPPPIVKLTDFGVAKLFARPGLTAAGSFVGTAAYLSPEQAVGKPATKRSDFYSLGGVLYCLLAGRPPFNGENAVELLHKHCHAQPERLLRLMPDLPHDLDSFVMRLLEKDPAKRPADGFVILRTLERIRGKLERKALTETHVMADDTATVQQPVLGTEVTSATVRSGPATVMADLMRQELREQNKGGPIARFFNHPVTLLLMLAGCIGLIVYGVSRKKPSAEELYAAAGPLMASDRPHDWERAWNEYLEPLNERFPDNPHKDEIARFRRDSLDWREQEKALKADRVQSEAQRIYKLGLNHAETGDSAAAKRTWQNLISAFGGVEAERRWVDLAERGLQRLAEPTYSRSEAIEAALARARTLRDDGKRAQAQAIWRALEDLYRDDPAILAQVRREMNQQP